MKDEKVPGKESLVGGGYALAAFGAWGVLPLYFKAVSHVPPFQIFSHRIVWSVVLLAILVTAFRRWRTIWVALGDRRTMLMLLGSTIFIGTNWLVFIWAVSSDRVMEISLGYYINPLVNVLLALLVLRERLSPWQGAAVALAVLAVANLAVQTEGVPWPSLLVAFSFGFYGLIRKTTRLESVEGLFLETMLMLPVGLGFLLYVGWSGAGAFGTVSPGTDVLLILAGVFTALPLIWFTSAARRLTYVAVGFFQYLAPTGHFLLAVFIFGETFTPAHAFTFGCIWLALAIFSADTWGRAHKARRARLAEAAAAGK